MFVGTLQSRSAIDGSDLRGTARGPADPRRCPLRSQLLSVALLIFIRYILVLHCESFSAARTLKCLLHRKSRHQQSPRVGTLGHSLVEVEVEGHRAREGVRRKAHSRRQRSHLRRCVIYLVKLYCGQFDFDGFIFYVLSHRHVLRLGVKEECDID